MIYKLEVTPRLKKEFKKLDRYTQKMIKAWIDKNLTNCQNPRIHGKQLVGNLAGQWRYRIGDYRLICQIDDGNLIILALTVGHRKNIYH